MFFLPIMLCIILALAVGCGTIEAPSGGDGGNVGGDSNVGGGDDPSITKLASVDASGVIFIKDGSSFWVYWEGVTGAQSYLVICGTASATAVATRIDLTTLSGFTMPTSGNKITVKIIAKGDGYADSSPTSITYEEGKQVRSPEIISFANGIITWKRESEVQKYTVMIDGKTATETISNTYSIAELDSNATIEIIAANADSSAATSVMYNAESGKLCALPISDYTLNGDILKWNAVSGAIGYKVVDLDFNSYVVDTAHYIMTIRNIVYGVYPVMPASAVVGSAEIVPVNINYLEGSGTQADPYIIKTPFDLRTIDYYEVRAVEKGGAKNHYKIADDINYNTVSVLESDSNMFTLRKPFFGTLDGDNKTLSNISVHHNNGFWAMFDYIADGGIVKNIKFDNAEINNTTQTDKHPINSAVAMVAYRSYGTVTGIALSNSKFNVKGGGAAGLVIHNYGTVSDCNVSKLSIKENSTASLGTAAYEMAGVVLENLNGGTVSGNNVTTLNISGTGSNIGSSAGIVSINRSGAKVENNSFDSVTVKNVKTGKEVGGVVAYCADGGTVTDGNGRLGTLTVGNTTISAKTGNSTSPYGKLYGKKG